jgi:CheY-like chemotaxis protein
MNRLARGGEMQNGERALLVMASRHTARVWAALESHGFEIDHALNCREAREFFQIGVEFDLVVCDLSLPDGNWWTIFRELSQLGHRADLVVCAPSAAEAGDGTQPFAAGLAELLRPPVDPAAVECVLERLGLAGFGRMGMASGF